MPAAAGALPDQKATPAPGPSLQAFVRPPQSAVTPFPAGQSATEWHELKQRLHTLVLDGMNLSAIEKVNRTELRREMLDLQKEWKSLRDSIEALKKQTEPSKKEK